jgi:hypothetical protein
MNMLSFRKWLAELVAPSNDLAPEWQRAAELISAIDAGGLPLNPARVNDIARQLGLEVSNRAPVATTVKRIRAALEYRKSRP